MLIKCCNPKCEAPFDYREGRLIRFSGNSANGKTLENHPLIRHFWLCGKCAGLYVFEYESGITVKNKTTPSRVVQRTPFSFRFRGITAVSKISTVDSQNRAARIGDNAACNRI